MDVLGSLTGLESSYLPTELLPVFEKVGDGLATLLESISGVLCVPWCTPGTSICILYIELNDVRNKRDNSTEW